MTRNDFQQVAWEADTIDDCRQIVRLAVREDLARGVDLTTVVLVPAEARGRAQIVGRQPGVVAGLEAAQLVLTETRAQVEFQRLQRDGDPATAGQAWGLLTGSTRDILTTERIVLNLLGRLAGIATLTRAYVEAVQGTAARIYDTRKTTPGWRRLEKYAVRCGGGHNHRTGLFDAILIKDNHLAQGRLGVAAAVDAARRFLALQLPVTAPPLIEVEVDTLAQLDEALSARPDLVLLDNMPPEVLLEAVRRRNQVAPDVELEASGGVTLQSVRAIAETGVDRISSGALTHSATALDVGLDWSA